MTRKNGKKPKQNPKPQLPTRQDFAQLVKQANTGDPLALTQLRQTLNDNPEIWRKIGDLGLAAENALVDLISGDNQLVRESVIRKIHELKKDLVPANPTALEKLAVQRIITCWLECEYTTTVYPEPKGASLGQQRFILKLKDSAHRRYDAAMKSFLLIQKLLPSHSQPQSQTVQPQSVSGNGKASQQPKLPVNRLAAMAAAASDQ